MKNIFKALSFTVLFSAVSAQAFEFRVGPKVGLGIGTPTGVKGSDAKIAIAPIVGVLTQFDFGNVGIDLGANYRYNVFAFAEEIDNDADGNKDTNTTTASYSSIEIPLTAYYKLNVGSGFFKFGGGAGLDLAFGKVKLGYDEDNSNSADVDTSEKYSFSDAGLKQVDLYAILHLGYELTFDAWALSIDLQPKYGLINKIKSGGPTAALDKWNTLWFDLGVGFLF